MISLASLGLDRRAIEEIGAACIPAILTLVRHWPAPWNDAGPFYCSVFDSAQDGCKNNDRIGERRTRPAVGSNAPLHVPDPNGPKGKTI